MALHKKTKMEQIFSCTKRGKRIFHFLKKYINVNDERRCTRKQRWNKFSHVQSAESERERKSRCLGCSQGAVEIKKTRFYFRQDGIWDLNDKISGNALWRRDRRTFWVRS